MGHKKQVYVTGTFTHRRTEADYLGILLDAVPLEEWRSVVNAAVAAAKSGDAGARAWLAQYLVGKPSAVAPAPLTVVVQQLSGNDPLVEKLSKPHIDRLEFPSLYASDGLKDSLKSQVADELRELEAQKSKLSEASQSTDKTKP